MLGAGLGVFDGERKLRQACSIMRSRDAPGWSGETPGQRKVVWSAVPENGDGKGDRSEANRHGSTGSGHAAHMRPLTLTLLTLLYPPPPLESRLARRRAGRWTVEGGMVMLQQRSGLLPHRLGRWCVLPRCRVGAEAAGALEVCREETTTTQITAVVSALGARLQTRC